MNTDHYLETNREAWNIKTSVHVNAEFYQRQDFVNGHQILTEIELPLLGDLTGKSVLHLQCHFGLDTLAMARMGADVTGVDFSEKAIEEANRLADETGLKGRFICTDIYSLPEHLNQQFDIVFTSFGTIGWLPDLERWATVVSKFLKPGGKFIMADFHPVIWMLDDTYSKIGYDYFKTDGIIESVSGTYADKNADVQYTTISWNHELSELLTALLNQGLQMKQFKEFDFSPYNCFPEMLLIAPNRYRLKNISYRIPMVYAMEFLKP